VAGLKTVAALAASVATMVLAAGCGADLNAHTQQMVPAIPGVNADSSDHLVGVRDTLFAYGDPKGYPAGGTAPLQVYVFNNDSKPAKLTCVRPANSAATVVLVDPNVTPSPAPPPPSVPASPSVSASARASARPSAPPAATPSAAPTATAGPVGPLTRPACGASFSVALPQFGYAKLAQGSGRYLAVTGAERDLRPGDPWLDLTFTFTSADGTVRTVTAHLVPVGSPLSAPPRIPGASSEG